LSVSEVRGGSPKPYLLGGPQQPQCTNCKRSGQWADICQYKSGDLCADWLFWSVLEEWLGRGYELALQLTPCDLWPLLRGRTLFLLGDSQMLDFYKVISGLAQTPAFKAAFKATRKLLPAACLTLRLRLQRPFITSPAVRLPCTSATAFHSRF
jgi:hypothetical protein